MELAWKDKQLTLNVVKATKDQGNFNLSDIIDELVKGSFKSPEAAIRIETINIMRKKPAKRPKRCIIIFLETLEDFMEMLTKITPTLFSYQGEFVIIFVSGEVSGIESMFKLLWRRKISNVNILFEDEHGTVVVKTFFPFNSNVCGDTKPSVVNQFRDGTFVNSEVPPFPDKMKNLHKCTIRVATSNNSVPYIFAKPSSNGSYKLSGRDINLVTTLSHYLNFKIDYVFVGDEGFLYDNGTAGGALEMLINGKADLIVADYWLKVNRLQYIDYSMPYISQQIAFVIPPGRELSSFEKFIRPLDLYTWILLIIFNAAGFIVIYIVGKSSVTCQDFVFGTGVRKPYMNLLVAIFGGSQHRLPHRNFARNLLMMFLIFCLVMRTLYTGSLYRFLQSKVYHKEAQSIDDMINRDYKFYTVSAIIDLFQGQQRISQRLMRLISHNLLTHEYTF